MYSKFNFKIEKFESLKFKKFKKSEIQLKNSTYCAQNFYLSVFEI